jgi:hypothetical protein
MKKRLFSYFFKLLFTLLILSGNTSAELSIIGTLGVDLDVIGYSSQSHDNRYPKYSITRYLSSHFLNIGNAGTIKTDEFASYSLSTTLKGTYSSTATDLFKKSFYDSPKMNTLNGDITFFPKRTHPLRFYYTSIEDVLLRVSESNRTKTDILTPGLALVQKNKIDNKKYGSLFQAKFLKDLDFRADYSNSKSRDSYEYDFDEHRAIVIRMLELPGDITSPTVKAFFRNNISDDTLRIVSGIINEIIPPKFSLEIVFDTGLHQIQVIPLNKYKQETFSILMKRGQFYRIDIDADKFPTSADNYRDNIFSKFDLELKKKTLQLFTSYTYEDEFMKSVELKKRVDFVDNMLRLNLSKKINIGVRTSKNINKSTLGTDDTQILDDFNNRSMFNFQQERGLSASIEHEYKNNKFDDKAGISDNLIGNIFSSKLTLPLRKYKQVIMLDNLYGKFDQTGQVNNNTTQTGFKISNRMEIEYGFGSLTPLADLTINSNKITNDSLALKTNELSLNSSLKFERANDRLLGNFSTIAGFAYQKNSDDEKINSTKTISYGVLIYKNISENQVISINTSHNWKTYGGELKKNNDTTIQQNGLGLKPAEYSNLNSIRYSSTKWENFRFSSNFSFGSAPGTKRTNFSLLINAHIPYANMPLTTEIRNETTNVSNLPKQSRFNIETALAYAFSKINIKLTHIYTKEVLVKDTYIFYQANIVITRSL